jgi:biopolymer transport protein ExbB
MSIYLVAVIIWMYYHFRRAAAVPEALIQDVIGLLARKQFDRAYSRLAGDPSFLGRTLTPAVRKLPSGQAAAQRALELANEEVTMEMEHRTTYLATVGTLGPMIGLVGTVYGMIRSFQAIATQGATPDAAQLAAGISTALFVTLEGIALAVPAIAFYAVFRNRIARLSLEVQMTAEALLDQFAPGVRAPHPLAQPGAVVPTGPTTVPIPTRSALPPRGDS